MSKYNSENLMNALIEKVLNYEEFKELDKVLHYPLNMLIRDTSKLDEGDTFVFHTSKEELSMNIVQMPILRGVLR